MAQKNIFVLGINASPKKDSLSAALLKTTLQQCQKEGANTRQISLVDYPQTLFSGDYSNPPTQLKQVTDLLKEADGIIFATPVHWFNMSVYMKNLLDHLTHFEYPDFPFEGKTAGFIATCQEDGGMQSILQMVAPLNHLGFIIPPYATLFYNKSILDKSEGDWMQQDLKLLGTNIIKMITSTHNQRWGY